MDVSLITQPDIEILGIRIMEPVTTVTDLIIAAACWYCYRELQKKDNPKNSIRFLKYYFLTMSMATAIGGLIGHGFLYALNEYWKLIGWFISMISIALVERSAIEHANRFINPKLGTFFLYLNIVELIALMALTAYTIHFRVVQFHCVYGLLVVVFSFHLYTYIKSKDKGSKQVLYTIGLLSIAAFIFNYPVILNTWFNHRDFAHILMAISALMFLRSSYNYGITVDGQKIEH